MEELREAALGYYNNGSQDLQNQAWDFFRSLDTDGDGRVSMVEFVEFLSRQGHGWMHPNLFAQLDHNGDGSLDFWEVITLYYIIKTRKVFCSTCRTNLIGLYFTCTTCFDHDINSFDLCLLCYGLKRFYHHHDRFLDSYVLLRSRTGPSAIAATFGNVPPHNAQALVQYQAQPLNQHQAQPQRMNWMIAFHALEAAIAVGNWAGAFCTIM